MEVNKKIALGMYSLSSEIEGAWQQLFNQTADFFPEIGINAKSEKCFSIKSAPKVTAAIGISIPIVWSIPIVCSLPMVCVQ